MSKFIFVAALSSNNMCISSTKYSIKSLQIENMLEKYIWYMDLIENKKEVKNKNILNYFNWYNKKRLNKILDELKETVESNVNKEDKIILSKDIIKNKYSKEITKLFATKNIQTEGISILKYLDKLLVDYKNRYKINDSNIKVVIIANEKIDINTYYELSKKYKCVDIYSQTEKLNEMIKSINKDLGSTNKNIKNTNLSGYNLIINMKDTVLELAKYRMSKKTVILDDINHIEESEIERFKLLTRINEFYAKDDIKTLKKIGMYENNLTKLAEELYISQYLLAIAE
ncbi:MAG: hypothetical protein RR922_02995 [Clostridia bacterium]